MKNKSDVILKLIIFQKVTTGILQLIIAYGFYSIRDTGIVAATQKIAYLLEFSMDNYYVGMFLDKAGDTSSNTIIVLSVVFFIFGATGFVEAYGLHRREKWAEWLVVCFTGSFIPFELYELFQRPTLLILIVLVITCLIVYFVGTHKELFHSFKWKKETKAAANLEGKLEAPLKDPNKKSIKVKLVSKFKHKKE